MEHTSLPKSSPVSPRTACTLPHFLICQQIPRLPITHSFSPFPLIRPLVNHMDGDMQVFCFNLLFVADL